MKGKSQNPAGRIAKLVPKHVFDPTGRNSCGVGT